MVVQIQGLSFPFPAPPAPGKTIEVLPGVHWLSTYLPFRPHATNLWLMQDVDGWTMVDCGFPLRVVRKEIEAAWASTLGGRPVTRLIVTHNHPDHVGNCRWICDRWGIAPTITMGEHSPARILMEERGAERCSDRVAFYLGHGLPEAAAMKFTDHWNRNHDLFSPLPDRWERIEDGDVIRIGNSDWRVIVAQGHAPEQALLHSVQHNLFISGDQILPRTTSNVSILEDNPGWNPLALFLESNQRIARIRADVLVLPSHNFPFFGLHSRIKVLDRLRQERLAKLEQELKYRPQTAADLVPSLFGDLYNDEIVFALGEVIAQLHYLVEQGRAKRIARNGRVIFACA
jgi:glyoxylase-like metal-dependent hydrolase (beta-lactamase superfamily II)